MVMTMRTWLSSFTVFVFGTSTSIPDCRIGAVIMKMISSTRTTSMNGTMLISESDDPVSRCTCGMVFFLPEHVAGCGCHPEPATAGEGTAFPFSVATSRLRAVNRFNLRYKLRRKTIHARRDAANSAQVMVVGDHRGYGGKQARRCSDQRLGNSRRDHAQACRAGIAESQEGVHHAPYSAEQSDERRNRASRREPGHPFFQLTHFVACGDLHLHADSVGIFNARRAGYRCAAFGNARSQRTPLAGAQLRFQFAVSRLIHDGERSSAGAHPQRSRIGKPAPRAKHLQKFLGL